MLTLRCAVLGAAAAVAVDAIPCRHFRLGTVDDGSCTHVQWSSQPEPLHSATDTMVANHGSIGWNVDGSDSFYGMFCNQPMCNDQRAFPTLMSFEGDFLPGYFEALGEPLTQVGHQESFLLWSRDGLAFVAWNAGFGEKSDRARFRDYILPTLQSAPMVIKKKSWSLPPVWLGAPADVFCIMRIELTDATVPMMCPADGSFPATEVGKVAVIACGGGLDGVKTRECLAVDEWASVNDSICTPATPPPTATPTAYPPLLQQRFVGMPMVSAGSTPDLESCRDKCNHDVLCNAFTYWGGNSWCNTLSVVDDVQPAVNDAVSDYADVPALCLVQRGKWEARHADSEVLDTLQLNNGRNTDLCCVLCDNHAQCVGFSYTWKGVCVLFESIGGNLTQPAHWAMAGVLHGQ